LLQLGVLVRLPAVEQLAQALALGGDEPFVVVSAGGREGDRAAVSAVDKGTLAELCECLSDRIRISSEVLDQVRLGERLALAEACQKPQLRWSELEAGTCRQALVGRPPLVTSREQRERALDLAECVVVACSVEAIADIGRLSRRSQRHLA
jgi:hypothetical protein